MLEAEFIQIIRDPTNYDVKIVRWICPYCNQSFTTKTKAIGNKYRCLFCRKLMILKKEFKIENVKFAK